jgi:hypothetical protein
MKSLSRTKNRPRREDGNICLGFETGVLSDIERRVDKADRVKHMNRHTVAERNVSTCHYEIATDVATARVIPVGPGRLWVALVIAVSMEKHCE